MEFSNQYLDWNEYQVLGGTTDLMPFNLLEFDAQSFVDRETQGRLKNLTSQVKEVKLCIFRLIALQESINNGVDNSGNVINYNQDEIDKHKSAIVYENLINCQLEDGTPYLYRGL